MPHQLDRLESGAGSMFSVAATPWHREGTVLSEAPSLADALRLGGLDFDVELRPLFVRTEPYPDRPNVFPYEQTEEGFATVRTDREEVLGIVSKRYQPLQNRDAFGVLEPLLDAGLASLETGGALRGGRDVWMLIRFNIDSPIVREVFADEIIPFGLISNNHAGQRKVVVQESPIRVVCANTLGAAFRERKRALGIRHTASVEARTTEAARQLWRGLIERYEIVARQYRALKDQHLDTALFRRLVLDTAAPLPEELDRRGLTRRQEGTRRRVIERRNRLARLWEEGDGHSGDRSGWEAYNAVAQSVDHDSSLWRIRGSRAEALLNGRLVEVKDQVLAALISNANPVRS